VDFQTCPLAPIANRWPPPSLAKTSAIGSPSIGAGPYSGKCSAAVAGEWMKYPLSTSGSEASPITQ
jgi:hypothetical protein